MARAIRQRIALDIQVQKWLEAKGIDLNMVKDDYTLARDFGMTTLTITLFAGDFPLDEIKPTADHSQCGQNCTFKEGEELPLFVSNVTNRKHPTCIDVTTASERPYSSWICGPECPPMSCAFHEDCREAAPDAAHMPNDETECTCTGGLHLRYRFACPLNETP